MESKIFNTTEFEHRISVKINELNTVENITDILYIKLYELYNKCCEKGYIKENSINIESYSSGYLNPIIFVPFIEYRVKCKGLIFLPNVDDVYLVKVVSINKIGIMCKMFYYNNNKTYCPINIIIAKHTQKVDISNLKKDDLVYVKILALKFNKNSEHIHTIGNIVEDSEIKLLKDYSLIIKDLINIDINFTIDNDKLLKYNNILKFILDKNDIDRKELFIYDFIKTNKINNNMDYIKLYNNYIEKYNLDCINKIDNLELETETTFYENLDCETNDTDLCDKSSNIDEYDLDNNSELSDNSDSYNEEELEDEEESDEEDLSCDDEKENDIETVETDLTDLESDKKNK